MSKSVKWALMCVTNYLAGNGYTLPADLTAQIKALPDDDIDPDEAQRIIELYMQDYRAGRITLAQLIRKVQRATGATLTGEEKPQDIERLRTHVSEAAAAYAMYLIVEHLQNMGYEMNRDIVERLSKEADPYKPEPLTRPIDGSQSEYGGTIEQIIRGFYAKKISYAQAIDRFTREVEKQFTSAWQDGMNDAGVNPEDMTKDEKALLDAEISKETTWVLGFLMDVDQASAAGEPIEPLLARVPLWANRYAQIRTQAKIEAAKNQPLEWQLGATEKHCQSCAKLAGVVKRAQVWRDAGVLPQNAPNGKLECGGWQCDCRLEPTDKPITRGPLPALP